MQPDVRIVLRFWKKPKRRNKNNIYIKSPEDFSGIRPDYLPGIFVLYRYGYSGYKLGFVLYCHFIQNRFFITVSSRCQVIFTNIDQESLKSLISLVVVAFEIDDSIPSCWFEHPRVTGWWLNYLGEKVSVHILMAPEQFLGGEHGTVGVTGI